MKSEKRQKFFARLQTLLMVPHQPCLLLSAVVSSSSAYVASPNLRDDDCLMIILIPSEEWLKNFIYQLSDYYHQKVFRLSLDSILSAFRSFFGRTYGSTIRRSSCSHQGVIRKSSRSH